MRLGSVHITHNPVHSWSLAGIRTCLGSGGNWRQDDRTARVEAAGRARRSREKKSGRRADVLLFDRRSVNSWEEAVNTLQLMQAMKLSRVLVVSDPPHMRRLSWVWGKVFEGSGKTCTLVATDTDDWDAEHWWRLSANAQFVFAEYIKFAYYLVQY